MSTPHLSSRHSRPGKMRRRPPTRLVPFKVFIGYADIVAVRHATATIADAVRSRGMRFQIIPMLWRFEQLATDYWRDRAVQAALDADVVVLASSEPSALSPSIEAWVNGFLAANRGRSTTLVAIAGPTDAWTISIQQENPASSVVSPAPPPAVETADLPLLCSRR